MSNANLKKLIESATADLASSSSSQDLVNITKRFCDYRGSLTFDKKNHIIFSVIGLLTAIAGFVMLYVYGNSRHYSGFNGEVYGWAFMFSGLFVLITAIILMALLDHKAETISKDILFKSALFNHGLSSREGRDNYLDFLQKTFPDYERGNHSNEIKSLYSGKYSGPIHQFEFGLCHYEYVNERVVVEARSDGKGGSTMTTRTVYDTYNRYALIIDFPWVKNVYAQMDGQKSFENKIDTAHPDFKFKVTGADPISCSKFLKPATVMHLLDMQKQFDVLNFEFSDCGYLNMSFSNDNLLETSPNGLNISQPAALLAAVEAKVKFPALESALEQIHLLAEQHDNNFDPPQKTTA